MIYSLFWLTSISFFYKLCETNSVSSVIHSYKNNNDNNN